MIVAFGTSTPTSITVVATRTSSSPRLNSSISARRSAGRSRPWSEPTRIAAKLGAPQALGLLLGRARLDGLRLRDERADDVGLAPVVQVPAEALVGLGAALVRHPARDDRLPAARRPRDLRHVEVAVDRLRERSRDRRRRHVQDVRGTAFRERAALLDSEAVLLVDHGDGQVVQRDAFLDERVRPDEDLRAFELVFHGARLQRDADSELGADRLQGEEVLLGKGLGRSHERALLAALDGAQERVEGDDGLPRPDVALQEPLHGPLVAQIGVDLGDRLLLLGRERERKRAPIAVEELPRLAECRRARLLGERLATADEAELEQEELLEAEAGAGGLGVFQALGAVHGGDGVGSERQPLASAELRRERVRHAAREGSAASTSARMRYEGSASVAGYSGTRPSVCTPAPPSS